MLALKQALRSLAWLALGFAALGYAKPARAEDGGNEVCPATYVAADDIRERYDTRGRLVHQLRLQQGRVVEEIAILQRGEHAVARTELTPGHVRIARTTFDSDRVSEAECQLDGRRVGHATYRYRDGRVEEVEKHFWEAPAEPAAATSKAPTELVERVERICFVYDADGQLIGSEVRDGDGRIKSRLVAERERAQVPIFVSLSAGGYYQSDTALYDASAGLGIHRRPKVQRYGADPLEVGLDAAFRFHRAAGITSTDQTTLRFGIDYHDILPRITIFSFATTERNLPANLRLNLEVAVLGVKFEFVPRGAYQLALSFAPVWNFRSIITPDMAGAPRDETTSKLRGSFRARAGVRRPTWALLNTFEFLPTLLGDEVAEEDRFWNRTVLRNTLALDVTLTRHLTLREELKYTRDPAMRAQANCPDSSNPLCRGYAVANTTSLVLNVEL